MKRTLEDVQSVYYSETPANVNLEMESTNISYSLSTAAIHFTATGVTNNKGFLILTDSTFYLLLICINAHLINGFSS